MEKIGLWGTLALLILANLYAKVNLTPAYWGKLERVLQSPYSLVAHVELAQSLWTAGASAVAERELAYASSLKSISQNPSILGTSTTDPDVLLKNWQDLPGILESQYRFWQTTIAQKSDYRDAYLTLASLSYRLSRFDQSQKYLARALVLDPNSETAQKLQLLLSEN